MSELKVTGNRTKNKKNRSSIVNSPSNQSEKKQYNFTFHNKLNVEHQNRQFNSIYIKLNAMNQPKDSYKMLFHIDIVHVINKLLREHIHKELSMNFYINTLVTKAQNSIEKMHKLFILDEAVTNDKKKINYQYQSYINPYFNVIITFYMKLCILNLMQNKVEIANKYYQAVYKIAKNIGTSLTSNYKLLRKIGQFFIVYSVFLINSRQFNEAIDLLFQALSNQANIIVILAWRGKSKSKSDLRRRKIQLFNRLFAIFLNLSTCFQQKCKIHWSYICLKQCKLIVELKQKQQQKDIKLMWPELLKKYRLLYNEYMQIKKIIQFYFDKDKLVSSIEDYKKYEADEVKQQNNFQSKVRQNSVKTKQIHRQQIKDQYIPITITQDINDVKNKGKDAKNKQNLTVKANKSNQKSRKLINIKRSLSLQDNLIKQNNIRLLKDFSHQILFLGVNLFDTNIFKKQKLVNYQTKQNLKQYSLVPSSINLETRPSFMQIQNKNADKAQKAETKLKKRQKKIENKLFRKIQQPLTYDEVQKKIQNFWNIQSLQNNKTKQKRCLLQYKSQSFTNKEIIKQQTNIKEQIKMITKKQNVIYKQIKNNDPQEEQGEKGIHLFKKIILKNIKNIDIKKNQMLISILKKKRLVRMAYNVCSYSSPQSSIDYLIEKIKKEKNREELIQKTKNQEKNELIQLKKFKGKQYNHTFLTKNIQIPNLFLSFISSSGLSKDANRLKHRKDAQI